MQIVRKMNYQRQGNGGRVKLQRPCELQLFASLQHQKLVPSSQAASPNPFSSKQAIGKAMKKINKAFPSTINRYLKLLIYIKFIFIGLLRDEYRLKRRYVATSVICTHIKTPSARKRSPLCDVLKK